jgi:ATP-dependent Lon protease
MEKGQREFFLRQQLKAIQDELGEGDAEQAEINELRERLDALELPEDVERRRGASSRAREGCRRRRRVRRHPHVPRVDPHAAVGHADRGQPRPRAGARDPRRGPLRPRQGQGADHRVPRRLEAEARGLGADPLLRRPPGVGKTSLGQSIARTLGRKFTRISSAACATRPRSAATGRTYIGAMPGTIIRSLRDAESLNPCC